MLVSQARSSEPAEGKADGVERTWNAGLIRLILAEGVSVSGDWLLFTAASVVLFERTDSTAAVSGLWAAVALPTVVLGAFAGAIADRRSRKRIMVTADALCAGVMLASLVLVAAGFVVLAIYASVIVVNVFASFHGPASQALMPMLTPAESLRQSNSALRIATRIAMVAGPAVAAGLFAIGGLSLVMAVDAGTFALSAALVAGIRVPPQAEADSGHGQSAFEAALDGLRFTRRNRAAAAVVLSVGGTMLIAPLVNASVVALVSDALHQPESRYGVILAAEGAGSLALAAWFMFRGNGLPLLATGAIALLGIGVSVIALGVAPNIWVAGVANTVMGMAVVAMQVSFVSYLQQVVANEFRGRVLSLISTISSVGALAGLALTGPLVWAAGIRGAIVIAGVAVCFSALPVLLLLVRPALPASDALADAGETVA
jgi:MFS family permease